MSMKNFRQK